MAQMGLCEAVSSGCVSTVFRPCTAVVMVDGASGLV